MFKNHPTVSPFEQNYNIRRLIGNVYYNIKFWNWFRLFWKHPEADVFWYCVGPFTILIEPKD